MTKHLLVAALVMIACSGTGVAADKIRYEEIPKHIGPFGTFLDNRAFKVTTTEGKTYRSRSLLFEADHVRAFLPHNSWEDLSSEQVARIEIRQAGRFTYNVLENGAAPLVIPSFACAESASADACRVGVTALLSPVWAFTAATAPVYLASDAIASVLPPRVYEIVH